MRGRETSMCCCLSQAPNRGLSLQPRHVPWLKIKPLVRRLALNLLSHTSQGYVLLLIFNLQNIPYVDSPCSLPYVCNLEGLNFPIAISTTITLHNMHNPLFFKKVSVNSLYNTFNPLFLQIIGSNFFHIFVQCFCFTKIIASLLSF